jgi:gamma-glutamyltranspeptidase
VVGTPGGPTIITQVYHVISNVIDHRMTLAAAIEAPRLHHQALPDRIQLERGGFSEDVVRGFARWDTKCPSGDRWETSRPSFAQRVDGWESVTRAGEERHRAIDEPNAD